MFWWKLLQMCYGTGLAAANRINEITINTLIIFNIYIINKTLLSLVNDISTLDDVNDSVREITKILFNNAFEFFG